MRHNFDIETAFCRACGMSEQDSVDNELHDCPRDTAEARRQVDELAPVRELRRKLNESRNALILDIARTVRKRMRAD